MSTEQTPPEPKKEWYVIVSGSKEGPFSIWDLAHRAQSGSLAAGAIAWREGMPDWLPIAMIPELKSLIQKGSAISDLKDVATRALGGNTMSPETQALLQAGRDAGKKVTTAGAGFLSILFDLSFRQFLMLRAVKFIFICGIAFLVTLCFGMAAVEFKFLGLDHYRTVDDKVVVGLLIIAASVFLFFVFGLIIMRLFFEVFVVLFRIAENTSQIAVATCQKSSSEGQD